jgi:hypothetical protein
MEDLDCLNRHWTNTEKTSDTSKLRRGKIHILLTTVSQGDTHSLKNNEGTYHPQLIFRTGPLRISKISSTSQWYTGPCIWRIRKSQTSTSHLTEWWSKRPRYYHTWERPCLNNRNTVPNWHTNRLSRKSSIQTETKRPPCDPYLIPYQIAELHDDIRCSENR